MNSRSEIAESRPRIGLTMGDAAGIGPEVVLKALAGGFGETCRPVVIGDGRVLRATAERLGIDIDLVPAGSGRNAAGFRPLLVDLDNVGSEFKVGADNAITGRASAEFIESAVAMWRRGEIDAIATAPISKAAIRLGGYDFPGHTEFLAHLTGTEHFAMSFFAGRLRVVLLSTHVALRDAIELVTVGRLADLIGFADSEIGRLIGKKPRIAVAGLNPHASEGGMFGIEEKEQIGPAIDQCRALGVDVSGPFSSDTIFLRGFRGEFDAVVALYHDQATIPVKCLSFGASVNVTLGLPLIRTSVDHGTAFDIAGTGKADSSSMTAAVRLAAELAEIRKSRQT